jgi:hypothetical protein
MFLYLKLRSIHRGRLKLYEKELEKAVQLLRDSEASAMYDVRRLEQKVRILTRALQENNVAVPEAISPNCRFRQMNEEPEPFSQNDRLDSSYQLSGQISLNPEVHPDSTTTFETSFVSDHHLCGYYAPSDLTKTAPDESSFRLDANFAQMYAVSRLFRRHPFTLRLTFLPSRFDHTSFAVVAQARMAKVAIPEPDAWKALPFARCFSCSSNLSISSSENEIEAFAGGDFLCNCHQSDLELTNRPPHQSIEFPILTDATFPRCNIQKADITKPCAATNTNILTFNLGAYAEEPESCCTSLPPINGGISDPCRRMAIHIDKQMSIFIDFCVSSLLSHLITSLTSPNRHASPHPTRKHLWRSGRSAC